MQKNVKNLLIIIPMILLLCFSFINVKAYATDELNGNSTKVVSESKDKEEANLKNNTSNTEDANSKNSTSSKEDESLRDTSKDKTGNNDEVISKDDKTNDDIDSEEDLEDNEIIDKKVYEWRNIDGKLHYVTSDGIVEKTGWFKEKDENPDADNDNEYYLDDNYAATIGWKEFSGSWYYFNEFGVKQTGWVLIKYNWYYLNDKGEMETGWISDERNKYYLNNEGVMSIGKKYIDGNWYFFSNAGILQTGKYYYKGKTYYSGKDGVMVSNQWIDSGKNRYYVKADSSLATGNVIINGKMEKFDLDGVYLGSTDMTNHLFVKFLNVGNADCAFIKLPSGETALIDTGDISTKDKLVSFLNSQDLRKQNGKPVIDYIILTHSHSDHIGGLEAVLENFTVKKVYMPNIAKMEKWYLDIEDTAENADKIAMLKLDYDVYKSAMKSLKNNKIKVTDTTHGEFIDKNNILQFVQSDKDFGPIGSDKLLEDYWGINENSAIVYLDYDDLQVLFTGDIEWNSEKDFWKSDLLKGREVDVLKVPHHGHNTSSTYDFIRYLSPSLGVISRAAENINKETIESDSLATGNDAYKNLIANGVTIYETSENDGVSIYATEDGWNLEN